MILAFEDFEVDTETFEVRRSGSPIRMQRKVLDLILYLLRQRGRVATKDELLKEVWSGVIVTPAALTRAVKEARRTLGGNGEDERFIQTVRGRGYRFVPQVRERAVVAEREDETLCPLLQAAARARSANTGNGVGVGGRAARMGILQRQFRLATEGQGHTLLLGGEAGIGKSHLADRFAAWVQQSGGHVLRGRCSSAKGAPVLRPWLQVLRACHSMAAALSAPDHVLRAISALLPEWTGAPSASLLTKATPELVFQAFDAVTELLKRVAAANPTLVLVDDLTWADLMSLELLSFLTREVGDARIMILVLHGNASGDTARALEDTVADIRRVEKTYSMTLPPMDESEIAELVRETAGREPVTGEVQELAAKSGGNPLFLSQILQARDALAGAGRAPDDSSFFVREGVGDIIRQHIASLSEACRATLAVASVFGSEFGLGPLSSVLESPTSEVLDRLHEAVLANVVCKTNLEARRFRFAHTIVRDTIYHSMPPARRARLHGSAGDELVRLGVGDAAQLADIARHYVRAAPAGFVDKALDACRRVAEDASERHAYDEAARQYRCALNLVEMGSETSSRAALLLGFGNAAFLSGEWRLGQEALRESSVLAIRRNDDRAYAAAALSLTYDIEVMGAAPDAMLTLEEAWLRYERTRSPQAAVFAARLAIARGPTDYEAAIKLSTESLDLARALDEPACLSSALRARFVLLSRDPKYDARALVDEALSVSRLETSAVALCTKLEDAVRRADESAMAGALSALAQLAESSNSAHVRWLTRVGDASRRLHRGELNEAITDAQDAYVIGSRAGFRGADALAAAQTLVALRGQASYTAAIGLAQASVAASAESPFWRAALACVTAECGQQAIAGPLIERLCGELTQYRYFSEYSAVLSLLADAIVAIGDRESAEALFVLLTPFRKRQAIFGPGMVALGCMSRESGNVAALLGRTGDAHHLLEEAVDTNRRMGASIARARSELDLAALLVRRGSNSDRDRADKLVRSAKRHGAGEGARGLGRSAAAHETNGVAHTPANPIAV